MSEYAFVGPRSRDTARRLISAAEEAGVDPQSVLTTTNGYNVPVEILDFIEAKETAEREAAEAERKAAEELVAAALKAAEEKAAAEEAAKTAEAEASAKTARAPRAPRKPKASDAGEEKV